MFTVLGLLLYGPKVLLLKGLEKFGGRQLVLQCTPQSRSTRTLNSTYGQFLLRQRYTSLQKHD